MSAIPTGSYDTSGGSVRLCCNLTLNLNRDGRGGPRACRRLCSWSHSRNRQPFAETISIMAGDPSVPSASDEDADMTAVASQPLPPPPTPPIRPLFSISLVCQSNVNRSMEAHRVLAEQRWPIALYSYGVGQLLCLLSTIMPVCGGVPSSARLSADCCCLSLCLCHCFRVGRCVGSKVRLPGRSAREANVFDFNTPYTTIIERLTRESEKAAASIPATADNAQQRKQAELSRYHTNGIIPMLQRDSAVKPAPERWLATPQLPHFNLVLTFETRVYDTILTSLMLHSGWQQRLCHVVNIETPDNTSEAKESGQLVQQWVKELVERGEEWEEGLEESLVRLQEKHGTRLKKPIMHFVWWY